jgi:DNA-binding MarR family transcriptional regulator
VSGHVSGEFARALQARQVSVAEWVALRHIYDHPAITPGELATAIGMTRGAVSKVLDKLQNKQWVTGEEYVEAYPAVDIDAV